MSNEFNHLFGRRQTSVLGHRLGHSPNKLAHHGHLLLLGFCEGFYIVTLIASTFFEGVHIFPSCLLFTFFEGCTFLFPQLFTLFLALHPGLFFLWLYLTLLILVRLGI